MVSCALTEYFSYTHAHIQTPTSKNAPTAAHMYAHTEIHKQATVVFAEVHTHLFSRVMAKKKVYKRKLHETT